MSYSYYEHRDAEHHQAKPLTGTVIGATRVSNYTAGGFPDRAGAARWRLTDQVADLGLPDSHFIVCADYAAMVRALNDRYPSPVKGTSRVEAVDQNAAQAWNTKKDLRDAVVHDRPLCRKPHAFSLDDIEKMLIEHGEIFITNEDAHSLATQRDFDEHDIVFAANLKGAAVTTGYAALRYNPSAAKARRTRRDNTKKKERHESKVQVLQRDISNALIEAANALRMWVASVSPDNGPHTTTILEGPYYSNDVPAWHDLRAWCWLYAKLVRTQPYRALTAFQDLLSEVREARKQVKPGTAMPADIDEVSLAWLETELKARRPRKLIEKLTSKKGEAGDEDESLCA